MNQCDTQQTENRNQLRPKSKQLPSPTSSLAPWHQQSRLAVIHHRSKKHHIYFEPFCPQPQKIKVRCINDNPPFSNEPYKTKTNPKHAAQRRQHETRPCPPASLAKTPRPQTEPAAGKPVRWDHEFGARWVIQKPIKSKKKKVARF